MVMIPEDTVSFRILLAEKSAISTKLPSSEVAMPLRPREILEDSIIPGNKV
jgi:hypothetical protein